MCLIAGILEDELPRWNPTQEGVIWTQRHKRHRNSEVRTAEYHLRPQVVKEKPSEFGAKCGPHMNCAAAKAEPEAKFKEDAFQVSQKCGPHNNCAAAKEELCDRRYNYADRRRARCHCSYNFANSRRSALQPRFRIMQPQCPILSSWRKVRTAHGIARP